MEPEQYAKLTIIILPINSVLNPIIYSRLHHHVSKRISHLTVRYQQGVVEIVPLDEILIN